VGRGDGLELDKGAQALDVIEMDAYLSPQKEASLFGDHDLEAEGFGESCLQLLSLLDVDDSVPALSLSGPIGPLVEDQLSSRADLFPQLQPSLRYMEIGVALDQDTVCLGAKLSAN
jgi:hypothetical protein